MNNRSDGKFRVRLAGRGPRVSKASGFTRTDAVAVFAGFSVLVALAAVGAYLHDLSGSAARVARCAGNLRALGLGMALYERDNNDRLPYAYVEYDKIHFQVWDASIFPEIPRDARGMVQKHLLLCPSDNVPSSNGGVRRSYAMSAHSMNSSGWPLSPDNETGVGIWWDDSLANKPALTDYISVTRQQNGPANTPAPAVTIPAITLDLIQAPASTLLLTERVSRKNVAFGYKGAIIHGPDEHFDPDALNDPDEFQGGKINYLMVDGHVELLSPDDSQGPPHNIWTIRPDD